MAKRAQALQLDFGLAEQRFAKATAINDKTVPDITVEVDLDTPQDDAAALRICINQHVTPHTPVAPMARTRRLGAGLNKVKAETALSVLAYNILRAINLVGALGLRAAAAKAQSDQLQVDIQVALLRNLLEELRRDTEAREEDHQRRDQDLRQDRDRWQRR